MSYSYERYSSRTRRDRHDRSALGYWLPLGLTVAAATLTLAAWVWSERTDDDYFDEEHEKRGESKREGDGSSRRDLGPSGQTEAESHQSTEPHGPDDTPVSVMARMSGAIRRTPSPQQIFHEASRRVAAGVAAAGAAFEGALSSIREEEADDFGDHSRWSEETRRRDSQSGKQDERAFRSDDAATTGPEASRAPVGIAATAAQSKSGPGGQSQRREKRRSVAMVVSADAGRDVTGESGYYDDDTSILSHLPARIDHAAVQLFVLVYAPDLKQYPPNPNRPVPSVTSSFSNIATPGEELDRPLGQIDPVPAGGSRAPSPSSVFQAIYANAQALVEKDTMILPFTTSSGYVHLLRHLAPDLAYIQDSLTGKNGELIEQISGGAGQIIIVVGADDGHGGLVDSDDEAAQGSERAERWWKKSDKVGLGKGIEIVDGFRLGEDWKRRVEHHD